MIAVIQRVKESSVYIDNEKYSEIKSGLNVLLCVTQDDSESDVYYLADKIVKLRIFADEQDKMNLSLLDLNKELLVISQFTLAADTKKVTDLLLQMRRNRKKVIDYINFCKLH